MQKKCPDPSLEISAPLPPSALPNSYIAYCKGWAHYSTYLGFELGIYENEPLKEVGFLLENILNSAGMVADIGIHEFGWTKVGLQIQRVLKRFYALTMFFSSGNPFLIQLEHFILRDSIKRQTP